MLLGRRMRYFFKRDEGDLDPKMYMRRPVNGGAGVVSRIKAATIMGRGRGAYVRGSGASAQRVTVKTKVKTADTSVAHARYLEKEAAGLAGEEAHGFTATQDRVDLKEIAKEWSED